MDDLQISPNRNEIRMLHANVPRYNYDIEAVDDIEIIGRNKEDFEVEQIDKISLQDKMIQNRYGQLNQQRDDFNIRASEEYNINYNDNRLKRPRQVNQEYISEENENIYRYDENYNININQQIDKKKQSEYMPYGQEKDKYRLLKQEPDYLYEKESWNKNNDIQQISNIFIPQQRNSQSYTEGRGQSSVGYGPGQTYKNNWNEQNRTQGIVNLSVIDDNKKQQWDLDVDNEEDMAENRENSDEEPKDDENNEPRNRDVKREIRQIHNDYDSDELNDIDPLSGLKKHGKQSKYDDYIKSQSQMRYTGKSKEGDDKDKTDKKGQSPIPAGTSKYMVSHESSRRDDFNLKGKKDTGKYQPSSSSYKIQKEDDEDLKERKGTGKFQPSQVGYMYGPSGREDDEDVNEKKGTGKYQPGISKYQYEQHQSGGDEEDVKEKKGTGKYQPSISKYQYEQQQGGRDEEDVKEKKGTGKYQPRTVDYVYGHSGRDDEEDVKEKKGTGKYQPSTVSYKYGHSGSGSGRDDEEDVKEKKGPGQSYMISREIKGDDKDKRQGYKPTSMNYMISNESRREDPKIIINQPRNQSKYQYKSKEITGMMKKKPKVKNIEYLRDPNQSQNFQ